MATNYLPSREADLAAWSTNFNAKIVASPETYGLNALLAAGYTPLHTAYLAAYQAAQDNDTRTPSLIVTKRDAKAALTAKARELAMIVQAYPGTTDTMRSDLGLTVPDVEPTPVPPPSVAPGMDIVSVAGRTVRIRLHDPGSQSSRSKPAGVKGASIYTYVGASAPSDIESWKYEGSTTKLVIDVEFPPTIEPGATVWFTAYWTNGKFESGPPCQPLSTNVPGGLPQAA